MRWVVLALALLFAAPAFAQSHTAEGVLPSGSVGSDEIEDGGVATADLAENAATADKLSALTYELVLCGQNAENGTIYMGPAATFGEANGDASIGSTACDALDNATEATADAVLMAAAATKVYGLVCVSDATLGANETIDFTLRSAEADLTPSLTCSLAEGETSCVDVSSTTTDIAAGATIALEVVQSSDNTDDNSWCKITFGPTADGAS